MTNLEVLQGEWRAVFLEDDGRKKPDAEVRKTRVKFSGDRYILSRGDCEFHGFIIRVDPATHLGAIDFLPARRSEKKAQPYRGLFLLEGEELTVCVAPPGKERPTDLDSKPGSGYELFLLRR